MAAWTKKIPWSFVLLLTGSLGQTVFSPPPAVKYPDPICAVRGSTVTILCSFTPAQFVGVRDGGQVPLRIVRVVWCQDHLICQGSTPAVYDSTSTNNDLRYSYLGDLRGNCTLQIRDIQSTDSKIHRFRMETDPDKGHFTGQLGVKVQVVDGIPMRISSSRSETVMRAGSRVTLTCNAVCSFHQLDVTWYRDDHALSETGPALQLNALTAAHSGNYSCALKTNVNTRSVPYSLTVDAEEDNGYHLLIGGVVVALAVLILILVFIIIKRKRAAAEAAANKQQRGCVTVQSSDAVYSNVQAGSAGAAGRGGDEEDVSYAAVQFKNKHVKPASRGQHQVDEDVVYSSVARQ